MAAATRDELRRLIDELPDEELSAVEETLRRLTGKHVAPSRLRRQQRLREAGMLESAAQGMDPKEFWGYNPPTIRGEPLAQTVIRERR